MLLNSTMSKILLILNVKVPLIPERNCNLQRAGKFERSDAQVKSKFWFKVVNKLH